MAGIHFSISDKCDYNFKGLKINIFWKNLLHTLSARFLNKEFCTNLSSYSSIAEPNYSHNIKIILESLFWGAMEKNKNVDYSLIVSVTTQKNLGFVAVWTEEDSKKQ